MEIRSLEFREKIHMLKTTREWLKNTQYGASYWAWMTPGESWLPDSNTDQKGEYIRDLISDALSAHDLLEIAQSLADSVEEILPLIESTVFMENPYVTRGHKALGNFRSFLDALTDKKQ